MTEEVVDVDAFRRQERVILTRALAALDQNIGRCHRKSDLRKCCVQKSQPIVEFMIAQRPCVIIQRIHRSDHRVNLSI